MQAQAEARGGVSDTALASSLMSGQPLQFGELIEVVDQEEFLIQVIYRYDHTPLTPTYDFLMPGGQRKCIGHCCGSLVRPFIVGKGHILANCFRNILFYNCDLFLYVLCIGLSSAE